MNPVYVDAGGAEPGLDERALRAAARSATAVMGGARAGGGATSTGTAARTGRPWPSRLRATIRHASGRHRNTDMTGRGVALVVTRHTQLPAVQPGGHLGGPAHAEAAPASR